MKAIIYGRFSTEAQSEGDSERRQIEAARRFCDRQAWTIAEELFERGRSGYHGQNVKGKNAKLGDFLKRVEAGKIGHGYALIFENWDRFSRQPFSEVYPRVQSVLRRGVVLVSITPELILTRDNVDDLNVILTFVLPIVLGYEESRKKSNRLKEHWEEKRRQVIANPGTLLTTKVPSWITVQDGKPQIDPVKGAVVRRVFDLSRKGYGLHSIQQTLIKESVPPISKASTWHESYVERLLHNRSVIGERELMRMEKGKRVPVGIIKGYFPEVVSPEVFNAVQQAIAARRQKPGGLVTKRVSNLFTQICYETGCRMAYRIKNHVGYLQTAQCVSAGIRYDHFERVLLYWLHDVKLHLDSGNDFVLLSEQAADLEKRITIAQSKMRYHDNLGDLMDMIAGWKRELGEIKQKQELSAVPLQSQMLHSKGLIEAMKAAPESELEGLRRELRQVIAMMIERIDVRIDSEKKGTKKIRATVTFKDRKQQAVFYETVGGRIVRSGVCRTLAGDFTRKTVEAAIAVGKGSYNFLVDVDPSDAVRQKCRELRDTGKQINDISAELCLHRVTVHRYLKQTAKAKVLATKALEVGHSDQTDYERVEGYLARAQ